MNREYVVVIIIIIKIIKILLLVLLKQKLSSWQLVSFGRSNKRIIKLTKSEALFLSAYYS